MTDADSTLTLQRRSLIVLCGPAGAGKSTCAAEIARRSHLASTAIVASDACRLQLCDRVDELAAAQWEELQARTERLFVTIIGMRMSLGRPVLADGVNVQRALRAELLGCARTHGYRSALLVFDLPLATCLERNAQRDQRLRVPQRYIRAQRQALESALPHLADEGWDDLVRLDGQCRNIQVRVDDEVVVDRAT